MKTVTQALSRLTVIPVVLLAVTGTLVVIAQFVK
jgi:hypothetical protein